MSLHRVCCGEAQLADVCPPDYSVCPTSHIVTFDDIDIKSTTTSSHWRYSGAALMIIYDYQPHDTFSYVARCDWPETTVDIVGEFWFGEWRSATGCRPDSSGATIIDYRCRGVPYFGVPGRRWWFCPSVHLYADDVPGLETWCPTTYWWSDYVYQGVDCPPTGDMQFAGFAPHANCTLNSGTITIL